ncbi:MAG TPA: GAF domain-containing protein [Mucilaginibacter sp.]|nr:GAF domain-containing protein [Mucilaginibacter sp.]
MIINEKHFPESAQYVDLDLENDRELSEIVELAAAVTSSSIAMIALLDDDLLHLKVRKGFDILHAPADTSMCTHALNGQDLIIIPDTFKDARFIANVHVQSGLGIRFFAAMPLVAADGKKIGVLGVYDTKPKTLDEHQALVVKILAAQAVKTIELKAGAEALRIKQQELEEQKLFNTDASIRLRSFFESSINFHVLLGKSGEVIDFNKTAVAFIRTVHKAVLKRGDQFVKYLHPAFVSTFLKRYNQALEGTKSLEEGSTHYEDMGTIWWEAAFESARDDNNEIIGISYLIRNVTERKLKEQKIIDQNKSLLKIAHIQAHEFRAPLTSIMGLMGLIKDTEYQPPREYLELLDQAVTQLDEKIKSIVTDIDNTVISPYVPHYE